MSLDLAVCLAGGTIALVRIQTQCPSRFRLSRPPLDAGPVRSAATELPQNAHVPKPDPSHDRSDVTTVVSRSDGVTHTTVLAEPPPPRRHWRSLLVGLVLVLVALVQFGQRYLQAEPPRRDVSDAAPTSFAGMPVALEDTPNAGTTRASVALRVGEQRFSASDGVWRDPGIEANDWLARYDGRFRVAVSEAPGTSLAIVEVLREDSDVSDTAWRSWLLNADGHIDTQRDRQPAAEAERQIALTLYGREPVRASLWPPPSGLILGSFLLLGAGLYRRPASWPSVGLVCVAASFGCVAAWPIMLQIGLGRTLPGVMIGAFITACVAALLGRRAQGLLGRGRFAGYAAGVAFAGALFVVFVNTYVTVGGFVAPVFRMPGEIVSPMDLLVADYVAPAIGLLSSGMLPALISGALFAWWWRRRERHSEPDSAP